MEDYNQLAELKMRIQAGADKRCDPKWLQVLAAADNAAAVPDSIVTSLTSFTKDAVLYRQ